MLGLRQIQRQNAIGVAGLGAFWIDRGREDVRIVLEILITSLSNSSSRRVPSILLQCRKIEKLIRI